MIKQPVKKRFVAALSLLGILATSVFSQAQLTGPSWDGYARRGRVNIRAGGSIWTVNGMPVSHTEEIYDSADAAQYVLSRLKGKMRPASEVSPNAGSLQFKVTTRKSSIRIAWVCGTDLHYIEARTFAAAVAFLGGWGFQNCTAA